MGTSEDADGDAHRHVERRPSLTLSFHGIAKASDPSLSPGGKQLASPFRTLDRRLSVEHGGAGHQSPLAGPRKVSLGVPSPSQLSLKNSLEVPTKSPLQHPSSPTIGTTGPESSSLSSAQSCPTTSPRTPFATALQRRSSLDVPFDRRASIERRPSNEDFKLQRQISADDALATGYSPIRRLSSASLEAAESQDRTLPVPLGRRDSRSSAGSEPADASLSDGRGSGEGDDSVHLSPNRSPLHKRSASVAFDYTAFEAARPEAKRPRSPSLPKVQSPLHGSQAQMPHSPLQRSGSGGISLSRSSYPNIFADADQFLREMGNRSGSSSPRGALGACTPPRARMSSPNSFAVPDRPASSGNKPDTDTDPACAHPPSEVESSVTTQPRADRLHAAGSSPADIASEANNTTATTTGIISPANATVGLATSTATTHTSSASADNVPGDTTSPRIRSPSMSGTGSPRPRPGRINVVSVDEESGMTFTLDHDEDTVEIQIECPPARHSPAHP